MPLPWHTFETPGTEKAESISSAFTSSGVACGLWSRIRAAAPATTAAAWEVPLPRKNRSPTRAPGWSRSAEDPGTRRPITERPGATTST